MSWQQIKALQEKRGEKLAAMKAILNGAEKRDVSKRDLTPEETTQFDALHKEAEGVRAQIDQLERVYNLEKDSDDFAKRAAEAGKGALGNGGAGGGSDQRTADEKLKEHRAQFGKYLRSVGSGPKEYRALTVAGQGVVGDRPFYNQLVVAMKSFTGVRDAGADVIPSSNGNQLTIPTMNDTTNTGVLTGEGVESDVENEPALTNVTLNAYKFDSTWIKVSVELLEDNEYDLEGKITMIAGERIGRALNNYTTAGSGANQPAGFITGATLGYTGVTGVGGGYAITYDEIISFIHSVDPAYRASGRCRIQLHDTTLAFVRKLKDGNGRYIWLPGEAGQPDKLLGYGYVINNAMDQIGSAKKIMAFGDFSRYVIRDVTAVTVIRADELFIGAGLIGYKVFSRHDAALTDANAVKYFQNAA